LFERLHEPCTTTYIQSISYTFYIKNQQLTPFLSILTISPYNLGYIARQSQPYYAVKWLKLYSNIAEIAMQKVGMEFA